ncbi:MAG: 23S rRNA (pseudouridine(1915)-N(3))-methyltransferase RlmH [Pseudomonadota bacterium]
MKVSVIAVGRQKGGPEASLVADYLSRFDATGRALGLGPTRLVEVEDKKRRGAVAEGELLLGAAAEGAFLVALDERGKTMDSRGFAHMLADQRDLGRRDMTFLIGGADGHQAELRGRCDRLLSFGAMVWPHMLARVMLAEQLYRGASILAGAPYHRD